MMPFNPVQAKNGQRNASKRRVLFCATVDFHFKKFHLPTLKWFQETGWEVHVAAFGHDPLPHVDVQYDIMIDRSPFRTKNIKGYQELKAIIENNEFQLIHCHTPMGGVLTRLAARQARKQGTKVLYTAHGFHFCKGSPMKNWLIYYPIEKWLARYTDGLITINEEDFNLARNRKFRSKQILKVNGVGVDTTIFKPISNKEKLFLRSSFGFDPEDVLLFYAAEFNANKNQKLIIEALGHIRDEVPNVQLLFAGSGQLMEACQDLASELGLSKQVHFLGYQDDVLPYLHLSDIAVASSLREGLPVNIMEAMACGLPIVATDNRGHRELVVNEENGYLIENRDPKHMALKMLDLILEKETRKQMGEVSRALMKKFSLDQIRMDLKRIYLDFTSEAKDETEGQYHRANL